MQPRLSNHGSAVEVTATAMNGDTAQRRQRIQQLVRNEFPGCEAVFLPSSRSLTFLVRSQASQYRSAIIRVPSPGSRIALNKAWLLRQLKFQRSIRSLA